MGEVGLPPLYGRRGGHFDGRESKFRVVASTHWPTIASNKQRSNKSIDENRRRGRGKQSLVSYGLPMLVGFYLEEGTISISVSSSRIGFRISISYSMSMGMSMRVSMNNSTSICITPIWSGGPDEEWGDVTARLRVRETSL